MTKLIQRGQYLITNSGQSWHRIVCREHHGKIPKGWEVHHIDGNSLNNEPVNLIALPKSLHERLHKRAKEDKIALPSRVEIEQAITGGRFPRKVKPKKIEKRTSIKTREKSKNWQKKASYRSEEAELVRQFCEENSGRVKHIRAEIRVIH